MRNEISVYESLAGIDLNCIPRYYGHIDLFGQLFIALEYIRGSACDWKNDEINIRRCVG